MLTRRFLLTALTATLATPLLAQGKKGDDKPNTGTADGDRMTRVIGIDGRYSADGKNPDGSGYKGTVWITQQGTVIEVTWNIGEDTFRGVGEIKGNVVTVDWGDTTPVIYQVRDNGQLHGTWGGGAASEILTPQ